MKKNANGRLNKIAITNNNSRMANHNTMSENQNDPNDNQRITGTGKITTNKDRFNYEQLINTGYGKDLHNNARKHFLLGWMLTNLSNHEADWEKARMHYLKAAQLGDVRARFNLGLMQVEGIGGKGDLIEGFSHVQQAAQSGYGRAWSSLGFFYEKGIGTAIDVSEAEASFHKAIENGYPVAACNLAYLYLFHNDFLTVRPLKLTIVMKYLTEGEALKHPGSLYILGRIYQLGLVDTKDKARATLDCYKKAAQLGHYMSFRALADDVLEQLEDKFQITDSESFYKALELNDEEVNTLFGKAQEFEQQYQEELKKRNIPIEKFRSLQAQIEIGGYEFKNTLLFIIAMTRDSAIDNAIISSSCFEGFPSGKNLEWEGDGIMNNQIRSDLLKYQGNKSHRGKLDIEYQQLICNANEGHPHGGPLYRVAKALGLQSLIIMSSKDTMREYRRRGKDKSKRTIETQLSNHVEMLIGAIKEDSSSKDACEFVSRHWYFLGLNAEHRETEDFGQSDEEPSSDQSNSPQLAESLASLSITNTNRSAAENTMEKNADVSRLNLH